MAGGGGGGGGAAPTAAGRRGGRGFPIGRGGGPAGELAGANDVGIRLVDVSVDCEVAELTDAGVPEEVSAGRVRRGTGHDAAALIQALKERLEHPALLFADP